MQGHCMAGRHARVVVHGTKHGDWWCPQGDTNSHTGPLMVAAMHAGSAWHGMARCASTAGEVCEAWDTWAEYRKCSPFSEVEVSCFEHCGEFMAVQEAAAICVCLQEQACGKHTCMHGAGVWDMRGAGVSNVTCPGLLRWVCMAEHGFISTACKQSSQRPGAGAGVPAGLHHPLSMIGSISAGDRDLMSREVAVSCTRCRPPEADGWPLSVSAAVGMASSGFSDSEKSSWKYLAPNS